MSLEVNVKKKLRDYTLVSQFKISKADGCMGMLGQSGCGKSMTLKVIAGIETPDEGSIVLNGKVLFDASRKINLKPQERKIGYLFQNYALFPNMTVEENIAAGLRFSKLETKQKVRQMINQYRLEGLEKQYPRHLSGGQQQRVALARILAYEPYVLLLDEPFSAMDSYLKEEVQAEVKDLLEQYQGLTVLVTHDQEEVYKLSRQLMVIDKGKLLEIGETKKIFEKPKTMIAARMTGCKNLSRAVSLSENVVSALDWGMTLQVNGSIPKGLTYIGIRANDFNIIQDKSREVLNSIPIGTHQVLEDSRGWSVHLKDKNLLWKIEKNVSHKKDEFKVPEYLSIDPESILLLTHGAI